MSIAICELTFDRYIQLEITRQSDTTLFSGTRRGIQSYEGVLVDLQAPIYRSPVGMGGGGDRIHKPVHIALGHLRDHFRNVQHDASASIARDRVFEPKDFPRLGSPEEQLPVRLENIQSVRLLPDGYSIAIPSSEGPGILRVCSEKGRIGIHVLAVNSYDNGTLTFDNVKYDGSQPVWFNPNSNYYPLACTLISNLALAMEESLIKGQEVHEKTPAALRGMSVDEFERSGFQDYYLRLRPQLSR